MSTLLNLIANATGPMYVRQEDLDKAVEAGGRAADEVKKANGHYGPKWQDELDELSRRFVGMPSTEAAEAKLAGLRSAIDAQVKEHERKIEEAKELLETPYITYLERTHIQQKVAKAEEELEDFRRDIRIPLAQAKALVETCKTWNPKRPRFEELKKRKAAIDKAVKV